MISNALRIDIEHWASLKDERPIFQLAKSGRLTPAMVTRYIGSVTYLIHHTPGHLESARDGALKLGDEKLAAHYVHKLDEEVGHAVWGESDLESLTQLCAAPSSTTTPSAIKLATFLTNMIANDPTLYLTYLAFTEYITALLGPELLNDIENNCGVKKTSMTVIENHIELDRHHAEEGFAVIDDLVPDPRKLAPMRRALADILRHFDALAVEVTLTETDESSSADDSGKHAVSAA